MPDVPSGSDTDGSTLTIEVPRGPHKTRCERCGRSAFNTTGFVYRDGDAFAIYHATLHEHDGTPRVDLGIGIGSWSSDDSVADISAFLAIWPSPDEIQFGFIEPETSAWSTARLLQNQLTAEEARVSDSRRDLIRVAELVVRNDSSVARHLG